MVDPSGRWPGVWLISAGEAGLDYIGVRAGEDQVRSLRYETVSRQCPVQHDRAAIAPRGRNATDTTRARSLVNGDGVGVAARAQHSAGPGTGRRAVGHGDDASDEHPHDSN